MIQVGIIGAAGLSGQELLYWLADHPDAEVKVATSTKFQGQDIHQTFPFLPKQHLSFSGHDEELSDCDVVFLAIPNRASLENAPKLVEQGLRVIDLSGVYRIREIPVFEESYRLKHSSPELLKEAVFGLPEYFRSSIGSARLVANPGCYPTGTLLGILPFADLLEELDRPPIIDAKSGVSGAGGRVEDDATNYVEVNENFKAYKPFKHQHQPEITQYLEELSPFESKKLGEPVFTPYLLPLSRGILSGIYLHFRHRISESEVRKRFDAFAEENPFIQIMPEGQLPDLRSTVHSNRCAIGWASDSSGCQWLVQTSIDNLVKGASGQAIQNMNLMFGLHETCGLS
ncbi:MAG: N-acetyl-gamma-glutamyl-phosphate reductase [Deltaproteobacteria bacterium]|nr:N-acetyl-gamma-glutamyl-phosphate reductase [Deltaproteobacteria bacterium]